jgi:hypothetical protein
MRDNKVTKLLRYCLRFSFYLFSYGRMSSHKVSSAASVFASPRTVCEAPKCRLGALIFVSYVEPCRVSPRPLNWVCALYTPSSPLALDLVALLPLNGTKYSFVFFSSARLRNFLLSIPSGYYVITLQVYDTCFNKFFYLNTFIPPCLVLSFGDLKLFARWVPLALSAV